MNILSSKLKTPVIMSSILVVPLMILEIVNGSEDFPFVLFTILWVLPLVFVLNLQSTIQNVKAGEYRKVRILLSAVLLILLAFLWAVIVLDQIPCFLGVPNCD